MARKLPVIGIVAGSSTDERTTICRSAYLAAVSRAGGAPVVLPHLIETVQAYASGCDGLLFTGGGDFDPRFSGQLCHDPKLLRKTDPVRDQFEFTLMRLADQMQTPVLGVCRGMQWMAAIRGGNIVLDLPSEFPSTERHAMWSEPPDHLAHSVHVVSGSHLSAIVGETRLNVNSRHHQSVRVPGLRTLSSAISDDGVIEAIEWTDHPFAIGVQWHPEDLAVTGDAAATRLFEAFISAAAGLAPAPTRISSA